MNIYALATGAVIAVVVVLLFKVRGLEEAKWAYPVLLASFPVYYWGFAIYASDSAALLKEFLVGLAFLAVAYAAYKFRSFVTLLLLAVGYVMHAVYDFFHNLFFVNAGAPTWWPEFCGSVDVLIGAYIAYLAFSSPRKSDVNLQSVQLGPSGRSATLGRLTRTLSAESFGIEEAARGGMRTLTLRNMQQPSYLDTLLYSLVMELGILPRDAYPVRESEKLPPPLRRIVGMATHVGQSWGCWTDERRHWLFIAELPLTRGKPLLHLSRYDQAGDLRETSNWYCDDKDQWQRVIVP